ncbi:precorrin-3B C(17)-methyltransferase [Geoglobus sp.]
MPSRGKLYVVGIGPGCEEMLTVKAREVLRSSDYVIGHRTYLNFVRHLVGGSAVESGMGREVERVKMAVELAEKGYAVSLVSGGDPSIYGLASLVAEFVYRNGLDLDYEIVPGISALNSASPLFGSAISGDHAVVSLSDLLTPWHIIERRLRKALEGDFVIAIYNPSSRRREGNLRRAMEIVMEYRGDCFIGVAKNVCRKGEQVFVMRASEVAESGVVDMHTLLIIPSTESIVDGDRIITPRGYSRKYELEVE